MAFSAAVKINLSVFLTVKMVDRHAVWIVVVPDYGQNASKFIFQDFDAFYFG